MTDHDALLAAIADQPEEDTPRLMYADWLDESGQPDRAEFVRVQVELGRLDLNDPGRVPWVRRNARFLREQVPRWRAELPLLPGIEWGDFNRGLVEEVQARTEAAVVEHAPAIFTEPGVHVLRLAQLTNARPLADLPELARVRAFRLVSAGAAEGMLRELLASPYLANLIRLDLHGNRAGNALAADLAAGALPALKELWLSSTQVDDAGGRALAASPHLRPLQFLDLRGTRLRDQAVRAALIRRFGPRVKL